MYTKNVIEKIGTTLAASDIDAVEREIGMPLPRALRAHYEQYNGGMPRLSVFVAANGNDFSLASFKTMKWRKNPHEVLFEETYLAIVLQKKLVPAEYVPFAIDDGGNFFCMDRRTGAICYSAMDGSEELPHEGERIAENLVSFVDGMVDSL